MKRSLFLCLLFLVFHARVSAATDEQTSIARMHADVAAGKPLVAHVIVALCDNEFQGIVPVPKAIGNGDDPKNNLYWGARYGVKTYFKQAPGWQSLALPSSENPKILDQALFKRDIVRSGKPVTVYVLAEAWRGREIASAIDQFLKITRGYVPQKLRIGNLEIDAGSSAHLVAYVGHNGLMDFQLPLPKRNADDQLARSAMVLACQSNPYFKPLFDSPSALLLSTRSFMAPEAYSLEASLVKWFEGSNASEAVNAASAAYAKYQKISVKAARTVFVFQK